MEGVGDTMVTGCGSPYTLGGGSHLLALRAGWTPDARLTRQPRDTGHARGARVPRAASVPLAKRGDKADTRQGDTQHSPFPGGSQPRWNPLHSPSHLLSLLTSVTGSALGKWKKGSGLSIP